MAIRSHYCVFNENDLECSLMLQLSFQRKKRQRKKSQQGQRNYLVTNRHMVTTPYLPDNLCALSTPAPATTDAITISRLDAIHERDSNRYHNLITYIVANSSQYKFLAYGGTKTVTRSKNQRLIIFGQHSCFTSSISETNVFTRTRIQTTQQRRDVIGRPCIHQQNLSLRTNPNSTNSVRTIGRVITSFSGSLWSILAHFIYADT